MFIFPVIPDHARADMEPFGRLQRKPETKLFLGLINVVDGVQGARRRITDAEQYVSDFGVGSYCGLGRPATADCTGPDRPLGASDTCASPRNGRNDRISARSSSISRGALARVFRQCRFEPLRIAQTILYRPLQLLRRFRSYAYARRDPDPYVSDGCLGCRSFGGRSAGLRCCNFGRPSSGRRNAGNRRMPEAAVSRKRKRQARRISNGPLLRCR